MSKYATRLPDGQKYQRFNGTIQVLATETPLIYNVRVLMLNSKTNRNNWRYEKLADNMPSTETPILVAYPREGKVGDGHNYKNKRDPKTGEEYASFTDATSERIVGMFSPNDIRIETINGEEWIVGSGKIFAYYCKELVDMLTAQGDSGMEVSIETLVKDIKMDGTTEVYESYEIIGTTILGKGVTPAVAGATIRALTDLGSELEKFKLRVASYNENPNSNGVDGIDDSPTPNNDKGVRPKMSNKKLMAKMQKLFPDYRVLTVSEDGLTVGLYNVKENEFASYAFTAEEPELVTTTRFQSATASVHVYVSKDYSYDVPLEEVMDNDLPVQLKAMETEKEKEKEAREAAEKALAEMQKKEMARRKNAAKEAVKAALNKWNDVHSADERVAETALNAINAEIDSGAYDCAESDDGAWIGDKKAVSALNAVCADENVKYHEKRNSANKTQYVWSDIRTATNTETDGIAGLLHSMGVNV